MSESERNTVNEIIELFKKYYINYDQNKWKHVKTIKEFIKIYGKEHGAYFTPLETSNWRKTLKGTFKEKGEQFFPKIKYTTINGVKTKTIWIPTCQWNDKIIQQKYIKTANDLLFKHFSDPQIDTITIDLNQNFGGKETVMIAALSPLFNMSKRKNYVYIKTKYNYKIGLYKVATGCYNSYYNLKFCGSRKSLTNIKKINILIGDTASAGEAIAIAFKSISDLFTVKFYGYKTLGATSCNKYFDLKNGGGIEFPIGYMMDAFKNVYYDGFEP